MTPLSVRSVPTSAIGEHGAGNRGRITAVERPCDHQPSGQMTRSHGIDRAVAVLAGRNQRRPDLFVDAVFRHGPTIDHSSSLRQRDYLNRIVVGGFPEAVRRTPRRRTAFFASYLSTLIERDVLELANVGRHGDLLKLLSLLAARTSGLLVPATLAHQSGIPEPLSCATWSCCRRYSSSKAFQPGRSDKPTEPSARRN